MSSLEITNAILLQMKKRMIFTIDMLLNDIKYIPETKLKYEILDYLLNSIYVECVWGYYIFQQN